MHGGSVVVNAPEDLPVREPTAAASGRPVFGWDVGGAHVKVSMLDACGDVCDVAQWACALWLGLDQLESTIALVFARWPRARDADALHAVTMTGEMVDLFEDRAHGVDAIARTLAACLRGRLRFFAGGVGESGWLDASACGEDWQRVASANWLATAQCVASRLADAVLIDIGSTTTDIVPIEGSCVVARGRSDAARLATGELVYHGVVRTPLCGLAHRIAFDGVESNVMNEWFATTADVYRLTGELDPSCDLYPAADNGPKTPAASRARIARMIGRDAHEADDQGWLAFAQRWRAVQLDGLAANLASVLAAHERLAHAPLVGAGCGRFLVEALAHGQGRAYLDFGELVGVPAHNASWTATCAPGVAVALLAARAAQQVPLGAATQVPFE